MRRGIYKSILLICVGGIAFLVRGQEKAGSITYNYYSEEVYSPVWRKDVITAEGENFTELNDRQKALAKKQQVITEAIILSNLTEIAIAYKEGFEEGIQNISETTNNMPKTGLTIGLTLPFVPSATRTAIEGYIVSNAYDEVNNTDIYLIHFSQDLKVQPNIVFPFIMDGGMTTNIVTGTFKDQRYLNSNWTNTYVVTKGDIEYNNCHACYVTRPEPLKQMTIWTQPHLRWGSATEGIDYGNIVHLAFGEQLFSGILRDFKRNTYIEVKDGAIMGKGENQYETGPIPSITAVTIINSEHENLISPGCTVSIEGVGLEAASVELYSAEYSNSTVLSKFETIKSSNVTSTSNQVQVIMQGTWEEYSHAKIRMILVTPYGATYKDLEAKYTKGE